MKAIKTLGAKTHKGRFGSTTKGCHPVYGPYGVMAMGSGEVTLRQINSIEFTLNKKLKGVGHMYWRLVPNYSRTKKSEKVPMGKGAGKFFCQSAFVKANKVILEFSKVPQGLAEDIVRVVSSKLSFRCELLRF